MRGQAADNVVLNFLYFGIGQMLPKNGVMAFFFVQHMGKVDHHILAECQIKLMGDGFTVGGRRFGKLCNPVGERI